MPRGLRRFHESRQSHFLTFSCYHRQPKFNSPEVCDLFVQCLEEMRHRFAMRIYGYVVMPEHVHILVSEPEQAMLADAMHFLKLSFAKRLQIRNRTCQSVPFWQKRYYDRNVRDARIHHETALSASQSRSPRSGECTGRLEVEQFSSLRPARDGNGGNRIEMDRGRPGNEDPWRIATCVSEPRLASKPQTRTW